METMWLKEALFTGMTARAFKLGTVLTLGWFWQRVAGCSLLYRGGSMETIDFANILAVANAGAYEISPPSYVQHNSSETYFYVVRRVNNCGYQERTLSAAVKVSIDADGDLVEPQPNSIFSATAEQIDRNKVQLVWYYCPIGQKSPPACFSVYYDNGTGQIDYENSIAEIDYIGRAFYSYQSNTLNGDRYLFAIRAKDYSGIEKDSSAQLEVQLDTTTPDVVDILSIDTV